MKEARKLFHGQHKVPYTVTPTCNKFEKHFEDKAQG